MKQYNFYATLFDAWRWFLDSEKDTAHQDFIDRLNRKSFKSDAAEKGKAFEECVNELMNLDISGQVVKYKNFEFDKNILLDVYNRVKGYSSQIYVERQIQTSLGQVKIYGYLDKLGFGRVVDIKTTSRYEFPKFLGNFQHHVYPLCLAERCKILESEYIITDFKSVYTEQYRFDEEESMNKIKSVSEDIIEFIEYHKGLITEQKLFNHGL